MRLGKCPFCGGTPTVVTEKHFYVERQKKGFECVLIRCEDCGCDKWYHETDGKDYETAVADAADEWNRRTFYV